MGTRNFYEQSVYVSSLWQKAIGRKIDVRRMREPIDGPAPYCMPRFVEANSFVAFFDTPDRISFCKALDNDGLVLAFAHFEAGVFTLLPPEQQRTHVKTFGSVAFLFGAPPHVDDVSMLELLRVVYSPEFADFSIGDALMSFHRYCVENSMASFSVSNFVDFLMAANFSPALRIVKTPFPVAANDTRDYALEESVLQTIALNFRVYMALLSEFHSVQLVI